MRNRNRSFVIRLSDEEFQALEEKRKKSGYPREVFLRHLIADGTVREAPSVDYPKLLLALSSLRPPIPFTTLTRSLWKKRPVI